MRPILPSICEGPVENQMFLVTVVLSFYMNVRLWWGESGDHHIELKIVIQLSWTWVGYIIVQTDQ
jgi:hypothetical protein